LKLVCYSLRAIAYSDDEPANIYECKKPLVEIRWIKEVGKSKKEVDIAPFKTAIMEKNQKHIFAFSCKCFSNNVAVWQALVYLLTVLYCERVYNEQLSENSPLQLLSNGAISDLI
jgi:hypothetical protein